MCVDVSSFKVCASLMCVDVINSCVDVPLFKVCTSSNMRRRVLLLRRRGFLYVDLHIVLVTKSQHVFWICRHGYCYGSTHLPYVSTCLHIFINHCVDTPSLWVDLLVMLAAYCVDTHNICVDLIQCIFQAVSTHNEYVSTLFNCTSTCLQSIFLVRRRSSYARRPVFNIST